MTIRKLTALVLALLLTAAGACAEADSLYADAERWAYFAVGEDKDADIFIIAPTVDKYDEFNMTLDDNNKFRLVRALNMQKGIHLRSSTRMNSWKISWFHWEWSAR